MEQKIDAADIFDWDYLVAIGTVTEPWQINCPDDMYRYFAYVFTSVGEVDKQNRLLGKWLGDATYFQSAQTNESVIASAALNLKGDLSLLRIFARQYGVRLRRG